MSSRSHSSEKAAWHEAGHVTMAFQLDVPILTSVVTGHIETSATRLVTDRVSVGDRLSLYLGGAIGQYLFEQPDALEVKAVMRLLRSTSDANHDYLAAFRMLAAETKSLMESRRVLEHGVTRAYRSLSDPLVMKGLEAVAHALLEASPDALRGSDLRSAYDKARE